MTERVNYEGSAESKFLQLMGEVGYSKPVNIEIATVTAAPPDLRIKLDQDGLELEKDDVVVAERLTEHTRKVKLKSDTILGQTKAAGTGPHTHGYETIDIQDAVLTYEDELKVGDRVIVACLDEDMVYVVLDRAVWY